MRLMALGALGAGLFSAGCAAPLDPAGPATPGRCDAAANRSLIGSHVGAVDFAAGANVRIVCTTCAATQDYSADRLNVRFDQATGVIKSVDCG